MLASESEDDDEEDLELKPTIAHMEVSIWDLVLFPNILYKHALSFVCQLSIYAVSIDIIYILYI